MNTEKETDAREAGGDLVNNQEADEEQAQGRPVSQVASLELGSLVGHQRPLLPGLWGHCVQWDFLPETLDPILQPPGHTSSHPCECEIQACSAQHWTPAQAQTPPHPQPGPWVASEPFSDINT